MTIRRIVCIGNRHAPGDWVGPAVFDLLARAALPTGVELIDGGLAGLGLLRVFEGAQCVVFVDTLCGASDGVVALNLDALTTVDSPRYGHDDGLSYLLAVAPAVLTAPLPRILVLGVDRAADPRLVPQIARRCLDEMMTG